MNPAEKYLSIGGKMKIFAIGIAHGGTASPEFFYHLDYLKRFAQPVGSTWNVITCLRKPHAEARTNIIKQALQQNIDYLLFLDDDVIPPTYILRLLMEHKDKDIITGIYWTKDKTNPQPVIFTDHHGGPCMEWEPCTIFPVVFAGLGCCWINMKVFRETPEPWFNWDFYMEDGGGRGFVSSAGEDGHFFQKARKYGFQAYADSRILCQHINKENGELFPEYETIAKAFGPYHHLAEAMKQGVFTHPLPRFEVDHHLEKPKEVPEINPAKISEEELAQEKKVPDGLRVNLGCGGNYINGWINIDHSKSVKADLYGDIEAPIADKDEYGVKDSENPLRRIEPNSVTYVKLSHVFEHLNNTVTFMENLYPIMKDQGIIEIISPYYSSADAMGDPDHKRMISENLFYHFNRSAYCWPKDIQGQNPITPAHKDNYYPDCDFEVVDFERVLHEEWFNKPESEVRWAAKHLWNVVKHVRILLKCVKPARDRNYFDRKEK